MEKGVNFGRLTRRNRKMLLAAAILFALAVVWTGYRAYQERQHRDAMLGAMVAAFQEQNSLSVFRAQVPVFVTSRRDGWIFDTEQSGVIPATVEYRLDLSRLTQDNFGWDEQARRMTVTIPDPQVTEPALDIHRAKLVNRGILVTGNVAMDLLRKNAATAKRQAVAEARNAQMMQLAREAARKAMIHNVTVPLQAAGYDDLSVIVRFADEAKPDPSYIDHSRSYNEVLEEARRREGTQ